MCKHFNQWKPETGTPAIRWSWYPAHRWFRDSHRPPLYDKHSSKFFPHIFYPMIRRNFVLEIHSVSLRPLKLPNFTETSNNDMGLQLWPTNITLSTYNSHLHLQTTINCSNYLSYFNLIHIYLHDCTVLEMFLHFSGKFGKVLYQSKSSSTKDFKLRHCSLDPSLLERVRVLRNCHKQSAYGARNLKPGDEHYPIPSHTRMCR